VQTEYLQASSVPRTGCLRTTWSLKSDNSPAPTFANVETEYSNSSKTDHTRTRLGITRWLTKVRLAWTTLDSSRERTRRRETELSSAQKGKINMEPCTSWIKVLHWHLQAKKVKPITTCTIKPRATNTNPSYISPETNLLWLTHRTSTSQYTIDRKAILPSRGSFDLAK